MLFRLILLALLGVCGTASAQTGLTLLGAGRQPGAGASQAITVATPATQTQSVGFNISGTYTGTAPTGVDYKVDSGSYTALTSPTIGGGTWTSTAADVNIASLGSHTVGVREQPSTSVTATSGSFSVNAAYSGPLDAQAGATGCWAYFACSAAIASAATQNLVAWEQSSNSSHKCNVAVATSGQLAATTSNCTVGGDNGTALATYCNAITCEASEGPTPLGFEDQTGNGNGFNQIDSPLTTVSALANCFSTFYCYALNAAGGALEGTSTPASVLGTVMTIVAWVYPTATVNGTPYTIISATGGATFRLLGAAGNATANLGIFKTGVGGGGTSTCTVSINAWHSVAATWNAPTGAYAFYADGATCGSGTGTAETLSYTGNLFMGSNPAPSEAFVGNIRGVVTYTGTAYGAATVEAIMATGP